MPITSFTKQYAFLSNFQGCWIALDGVMYPSVEHAYQAAKTFDPNKREAIKLVPRAYQAKILGRKVTIRPNWETLKLDIMKSLLRQKFSRDPFKKLLLETGDEELIEGNDWGDTFWGQSPLGVGENHLGRLLMEVRRELRNAPIS
jgi:conserved hypothetical protein, ribA/ribD-fused